MGVFQLWFTIIVNEMKGKYQKGYKKKEIRLAKKMVE